MTAEGESDSLVQILSSQPSQENLRDVLRDFSPSSSSPSPATAAVIFVLVNTTLPELWRSLRDQGSASKETMRLLVECLSNISGVNALLMRLQQLDSENFQAASKSSALTEDILEVLSLILEGEAFSPAAVIRKTSLNDAKGRMLWNEYAALVGGSKILNSASKAAARLDSAKPKWICHGKQYSQWLGKGVGKAIREFCDINATSTLLGKALGLGYPSLSQFSAQLILDLVISALMPQVLDKLMLLAEVLPKLRRTINLLFAKQLLVYLSNQYFNYSISREGPRWWDADCSRVGAVATILHDLYQQSKLSDILVEIMKSAASLITLQIQRASTLAISKIGSQQLVDVADHFISLWGDKGYITHTPISAQERYSFLITNL
jgi:telomere length regulation protein